MAKPLLALALVVSGALIHPARATLTPEETPKLGSFGERCPEIAACAAVVGQLLEQRYVFDADLKGRMLATPNVELTRDNAELLFTHMLNINGYTRVPMGEPGLYSIMRQRDARDSALPYIKADATHPPRLPSHWDLVTVSYKAAFPEAVEDLARLSRSFMPANSRIIPGEVNGTLTITDSGPNLKKLYEIIRDHDQKATPEMRKRWAEREKRHFELEKLRAMQPKAPPAPHPAS